jgi:hypothetical protein
MVVECLAATAMFALTCGAVLWFMKLHDPGPPRPRRPPDSHFPPGKDEFAAADPRSVR